MSNGGYVVPNAPLSAPPARFEVLDSWRGVAALAVALRHINGTAPFLSGDFHGALLHAVDFFFVLSGFVIAASYGQRLAGGFSLPRFMVLRWGRVWPLHAAMVLIYLALETALALKGAGGVLTGREPFTGPRDLAALPASFLLLQAWIWPERDLWNVQSWSISIELGLYLGAALLWRAFGARAGLVGLVLALVALAGLQSSWDLPDSALRGIAGFGLGMACWSAWPRVHALALSAFAAALLELGLVAAIIAALATQQAFYVLDPLFAVVVLTFAREQGPVSRLLFTAPFRWLGVLSYALYMVHGLVLGRAFDLMAFAQARFGASWVSAHLGGEDLLLLPALPALVVTLAMLAAALAVAWLAWRFVEWPARAYSRRLAARIGPTATPAT